MNNEVRDIIEKTLVASSIYNEDCFIMVKDKCIEHKDFKSPVCSGLFKMLETFFEKNVSIPNVNIIYAEYMNQIYKSNYNNPDNIEKAKAYFNGLAQFKVEDKDSFALAIENFNKSKISEGVVKILNEAKKMAEDKDTDDVINYVINSFVTVSDTSDIDEGSTFADLIKSEVLEYNPYVEKNEDMNGEKAITGIYLLDHKYLNGGVLEGNTCVVAGRPGSGKTTFLKIIGINNAKANRNTLFISLEMSKRQIIQGYLAQLARVELGKILKNDLTPEEYNKLQIAADKEENNLDNYHIVESDSLTVTQLINLLIKYKKKFDIKVFCLDYIQQIRLPDGSIPKNETEYSMVSELIRTITKKLNLCAFLAAQVNRDCEKRTGFDRRPKASDLRSSGKLEQDATYILTTYRDEHYNKETEYPNTLDVTVAKNRYGIMGVVRTQFEGQFQQISNLVNGDVD